MERKVKATSAGDSTSFRLGQTILVFYGYYNSERADWGREEHYLCFVTRLLFAGKGNGDSHRARAQ